MERKEDATFICCGTDNEKNISDASPQKKQMSEVTLIKLPDIETESLVDLKTTNIAGKEVIKVNNELESTELALNIAERAEEEQEFKDEEGGYEDDQEDNAVEDVEEENIFERSEEEREFKEEKGGYEDDQEDIVEDDENGFTEMDEEGGYKDEDEGEEC